MPHKFHLYLIIFIIFPLIVLLLNPKQTIFAQLMKWYAASRVPASILYWFSFIQFEIKMMNWQLINTCNVQPSVNSSLLTKNSIALLLSLKK